MSWPDVTAGLAAVFAGRDGEPYATAEEWIREACEAAWGADLARLDRPEQQAALQRMQLVLYDLAGQRGDLAFALDVRETVAETFARYWGGIELGGPPWRLTPAERDRPTYEAYADAAPSDFSQEAEHGG